MSPRWGMNWNGCGLKGSLSGKSFLFVILALLRRHKARRISFEEALRFEQIHEQVYRDMGFAIVWIEPGGVADRAAAIKNAVQAAGPV